MSRLRRHRSDDGVSVIEAAIVSMLVFMVVFGIIEFGLFYRDYVTTGDAAGAGARVGSIYGRKASSTGTNADFEIIRAIRESTAGIPAESIERIVVFKGASGGAGSPTEQVPVACRNGTPIAGLCNVYDPLDAFLQVQEGNAAYFDCSLNPGGPACHWPPSSRSDGPTPGDVEYVGVWLRVRRAALTGFFGSEFVIDEANIARLEPGMFVAD